jgi:hypothetical protein
MCRQQQCLKKLQRSRRITIHPVSHDPEPVDLHLPVTATPEKKSPGFEDKQKNPRLPVASFYKIDSLFVMARERG